MVTSLTYYISDSGNYYIIHIDYKHSQRSSVWIKHTNFIKCTIEDDVTMLRNQIVQGNCQRSFDFIAAFKRPEELDEDYAIAYRIIKKLYYSTRPKGRMFNAQTPNFDLESGELRDNKDTKIVRGIVSP